MAALNPLISKARKPKFDLTLRIFDLNNVPLVTGNCFVKWHLPSSTSAEHRGRTTKSPILEHKVSWDYTKSIPVRLTIDKHNNLTECIIHFEVVQDFHNIGTKVERATLGTLSLNLAEYVEESEMALSGQDGEEGVVRRYLMMESKINSTLKIGICMKQIDGERGFVAPPLKTAAVFGGIAGIMAGEGEPDDLRTDMPSISKSRDQGELQDMYRRALAASWAAQIDELSADQCIEDIFNGGNGWKDAYVPSTNPTHMHSTLRLHTHTTHSSHEHNSDEDPHSRRHHRTPSGSSTKSGNTVRKKSSIKTLRGHKHSQSQEAMQINMGQQMDAQADDTSGSNLGERSTLGSGMRAAKEVHEFNMREDLVAWKLPDGAKSGS